MDVALRCIEIRVRGLRQGATQNPKSMKSQGRRCTKEPTFCHSPCKRPPSQKRWSDSSLQVEDPKASGTPTSLANTCAIFPGSATTMAAHSIMLHGFVHSVKGARSPPLRLALLRPSLVVRILGTIQERLSAAVDGICSLEPQQICLSGLGQSRELQLPRTATSAPAPGSTLALWSNASGQYR